MAVERVLLYGQYEYGGYFVDPIIRIIQSNIWFLRLNVLLYKVKTRPCDTIL